ncbi:MAG TPA: hypothetical protein VIH79_02595 [Candidatus Nanopelagicaceae bacterium]
MLKTLLLREAHTVVRPLPAAPIVFGLIAFGTLATLLFFVLRLDRD